MGLKPKVAANGSVVRERILVMGTAGTGKTYDWLCWAKACPDSKFWVMDTDMAVDRMLTGEFSGLTNVHVEPVFEWLDYTRVIDEFAQKAGPDDVVVVDLISPAWEAVQDYYVEQVYKDNPDGYFLSKRIEAQEKGRSGAPTTFAQYDWTYINKMYRRFSTGIFRLRCHLFATAELANIYGEDEETKNMFGVFGVKPQGQKHTAHIFHTVLIKQKNQRGEFRMLTVKDRERVDQQGVIVKDFSRDYLMLVGGWRPEMVDEADGG